MKRDVKVKASTRRTKSGKFVNIKAHIQKRNKSDKPNNILRNTILGAGAALGLSVATYGVLRGRYRAGIRKSAQVVKNMANKVQVDDLLEKELNRPNINFAVGGLWYDEGTRSSKGLADYVESRIKGKTIPINTDSYNTLPRQIPNNNLQVAWDMKVTGIKNGLFRGYNPTSRELAAQVIAYKRKYPDKVISLYGHSSGGSITNETMLILKEAGEDISNIKNVTYGANYYGINKTAPNSLNIVDVNDWQANPFRFPNATLINKKQAKQGKTLGEKLIEHHGAYHYTSNKEADELVKNFVIPKDWTPPKPVSTAKPKPQYNTSTDSVADEVRLLREARVKLRQSRQSLDKTRNNNKIPEDKKVKALADAEKKYNNILENYNQTKNKFKKKVQTIREMRNAS